MTASEYKIHFCSAAGALLAVVVDYESFHLVEEINVIGELAITLRGDHPALALLEHKSLIEVWRRDRDHNLAWTCEARYIYLYYSHSTHEIGKAVIKAADPLWFLSTRIVAYDAGTPQRTRFNFSASEIINMLVKYNATTEATVLNGRYRSGNIPEVTLLDEAYASPDINWECAYENLLATIQKLAPLGPGDFYLGYVSAGVWQFRWCQGQRGVDRSAALTFSIALDNMTDPLFVMDRRQEKTVAIVAGKIVRGDRVTTVRTGPDYAAGNDVETYVAAPGVLDTPSMESAADAALERSRRIDKLTFNLVQTPAYFYGIDYFLGDKINTIYQGVARVLEIKQVTIDAAPTGETSLIVSCG